MEQYAHLLVSADPNFVPDPDRVTAFFDLVQKNYRFQYVKSPKDWMPGILAYKAEETVRKGRDPYTGEECSITIPKSFELENISKIASFISGEPKYDVRISGKWHQSEAPLQMMVCDGTPIEQDLICFISCTQRAKPVCTSDWWGENRAGSCEFEFDNPESPVRSAGIFTHPLSGKRLEVPDAGSARFWIEFEFGKWLVPRLSDSFDGLQLEFVDAVQKCFDTRFVQAGRATG